MHGSISPVMGGKAQIWEDKKVNNPGAHPASEFLASPAERAHWQAAAADATRVLDFIEPGSRILVPCQMGEPATLLDVIDAAGSTLQDVEIHWTDPFTFRPFLAGTYPGLRLVNYFLGECTRTSFWEGKSDLIPVNFGDMPAVLAEQVHPTLGICLVSLPDADGYVSLGMNADYTADFLGTIPFVAEMNPRVPHTFGAHRVPLSQFSAWCYSERELPTREPRTPTEIDDRIATILAADIPDRACLQVGVGKIPHAILRHLSDHEDLGLHTEVMSDEAMHLVEAGALTGRFKKRHPGKHIAAFATGSTAFLHWLHRNRHVEFHPVSETNDPRLIGQEDTVCAINATSEVNLLGECCSETIKGRYYSSAGGQADFSLGALWSPGGRGYIVTPSLASDGTSRIVTHSSAGNVVTTSKNLVDNVVTEWGIARLRGRTVAQRARALIDIAHPCVRETLEREAHTAGLLH